MMTGKQKLYFLLDAIVDARDIAPSGHPLIIDATNDLNQNYRDIELSQLFSKLEKDEQVLKVLQEPSRVRTIDIVDALDPYAPYETSDDGCWHIELLATFDQYFSKIQAEPEYQDFTGKKPQKVLAPESQTPHKPSSYDRKALEKIWNVLQEIEEKRQLGTEGNPVRIPCYLDYGQDADEIYEARKTILEKLQSLEAIAGLHKGRAGAYNYWSFEIGNKYQDILSDYKKQYQEVANAFQSTQVKQVPKEEGILYTVQYSEGSREISVNGFFLAKPDFNRENEIVFTYLYARPNQRLSKLQIEKDNGIRLAKTLPKIIENLGFTGDRKIFFDVSSEGILFRNPLTRKDLDERGLKYLKLK